MIRPYLTLQYMIVPLVLMIPGLAQAQTSAPPDSEPAIVTFGGSARVRYETLENQYRPGLGGSDQGLFTRLILTSDIDLAPVRLHVEFQDSRAFLDDDGSGLSTGEVNTLEFVQAYAALDTGSILGLGSTSEVRAGRFKLDFGSRRLVGANNFRNTTNGFAGLSIQRKQGDHDLTLFYVSPQVRDPANREGLQDNDYAFDNTPSSQWFWGGFYSRPIAAKGLTLDLYGYRLDEDDATGFATRNRRITTLGSRLIRKPRAGQWDVEIEGAVQTGTARNSTAATDTHDLDVSASFYHLEVGRSFTGPGSVRVSLELDQATGDRSANDDEINRFDSLFGPRRPDFGPTGLYGPLGRSNIVSPGLRMEAKSGPLDGFMSWRGLWLDEPSDSFANTGVRDPSGASGRYAGQQIEGRVRYALDRHKINLEAGAAWLFNGRFLEQAPNVTRGGDTVYGYVEISRRF